MADSTFSPEGRTTPDSQRQHSRNRSGGSEVTEQVSETADRARDKVTENLAQQKERATDQLDSVTSALHTTSSNLRDQQQESIAGFVDSAADQVERLSSYVRSRRVGELIDDLQDAARREPALFIGGAAMLGILGARFFKSSERRADRGYDRDYGYNRDFNYEREFGYERRMMPRHEDRDDGNGRTRQNISDGNQTRLGNAL